MKRPAVPDHYATLHVSRHASPEAVRRAWRRLAQKYHPDRHRDAADAAARMAQINVAYGVLSDKAARASYDSAMAAGAAAAALTPAAARVAAARLQDKPGWAWALLVAVLSVTMLTLGLVALRTKAPVATPLPPTASAVARPSLPAVDSEPLVPAKPVQPWTEPPQRQAVALPETEPVARLVREGTLQGRQQARQTGGATVP